jgi:hypothetical protein
MHHVAGTDAFDQLGHGTKMAGLALYADLTESLTSPDPVIFEHRLESVKIFPDPGAPPNPEDTYGFVTASATEVTEQAHPDRRRAFCMAITDGETDGRPTLWSATVDALAFGTDVERTDKGLELLTEPMPEKSRLFVLSAGNVYPEDYRREYLDACDTRGGPRPFAILECAHRRWVYRFDGRPARPGLCWVLRSGLERRAFTL